MGRVLLASLGDDAIEDYLESARIRPRTPYTITSRPKLQAELVRVREQGWSIVENEVEADLVGVATPIRGLGGRVVAALNVSAHDRRLTAEMAEKAILPALQACSREVSMLFGSASSAH